MSPREEAEVPTTPGQPALVLVPHTFFLALLLFLRQTCSHFMAFAFAVVVSLRSPYKGLRLASFRTLPEYLLPGASLTTSGAHALFMVLFFFIALNIMEYFIYLMTFHVFHISVCFITGMMKGSGDQGLSTHWPISPALNKDLVHGRYSVNMCQIRTSLVIQWLKLQPLSIQGGTGLIWIRELRSHMLSDTAKKKKKDK